MSAKTSRLVIISGGQTGADRAALDVALKLGLPIEGWCPRGRWAEDGPLSARYPLRETATNDPAERTRANVSAADATLVLAFGELDAGTMLTIDYAKEFAKPWIVANLRTEDVSTNTLTWLQFVRPLRLNIAGPRESNAPGLQQEAMRFLDDLFRHVGVDDDLDQPARW